MANNVNTIDQELYYYEKLREIKSRKTESLDFEESKNNYTQNYGAKLNNQKNFQQFDGAEAVADDEMEIPEEILETIPKEDEDKNYAAFNRAKKEALDKAYKREKQTSKIQQFQKAAQAAKQLKNVKNIKQLFNLAKIATGITLEGLIVTYIIMLIQFIGGNIFKSKYIPPLGKIELIIFLPIFLFGMMFNFIIFFGPFMVAGGAIGSIWYGFQQLLNSVGISI